MSVVVSRLALRYCVIAIKFAIYSYTTILIINRNLIVNYLVFVPHFLFKCDNSYMHKSQTMKIMKNNDDDDGWRPTTTKTIENSDSNIKPLTQMGPIVCINVYYYGVRYAQRENAHRMKSRIQPDSIGIQVLLFAVLVAVVFVVFYIIQP